MCIKYVYEEREYRLHLRWVEKEKSIVFRDILRQLEHRHWTDLQPYSRIAEQLDSLADSIYEYSATLTTETMTSYDPTLPRRLEGIVNQMNQMIHTLPVTGEGGILFTFYRSVLVCLAETVAVYLDDNRLKNKERMKLKREEKRFGIRSELHSGIHAPDGFEDIILQLHDLSVTLDCLTETQKRRLIHHIVLGESLKEIAARENVNERRILNSINAALKKIRRRTDL